MNNSKKRVVIQRRKQTRPFRRRGFHCDKEINDHSIGEGLDVKKEINDHSIGEDLDVNIRKSMTIPSERTLM